jgi:cytochrome c biogenesis protein CcdA
VNDQIALGSAFTAGLASSIGPCIAPRYLMLAAYLTEQKERNRAAVFVAGCLAGYLLYAFAGVLIALLRVGTHVIYAVLAMALMIGGGRALTAMQHHPCQLKRTSSISFGPIFLAGLLSSMMFSPCCTPIAIALGLQAAQNGGSMATALLLAFGLGHTLPLGLAALVASSKMRSRFSLPYDACATVSGSLLLMVGGLYAILA